MPTTVVGRLIATLGLDSKEFERSLNRTTRLLQQTAARMQSLGRTLTRSLSVPLGLLSVAILKIAVDFDKSIRTVKALTGSVGLEFDRLRDKALELGRTTVFSAREAAGGMAFLAQAGQTAVEILQSIGPTTALAAAGAIDLSRAADIVTNVMRAFRLEAKDTARVSDILAHTFSRTNTNLEQLGDAIKLVAPVANQLGIEVNEVAAALGFLGDAGLQGTIAGTSLNQALQSLLKGSEGTKEAMSRLNFEFRNTAGDIRPIADLLEDLEKEQKNFGSTTEFVTQIVELFGTRGARSFASLIGLSGELRAFTERVKEQGFAAAIADEKTKGLFGSLKFLVSALEGAALALADAGLADFIKKTADGLSKLTRKFAGAESSTLRWVLAITTLVALLPILVFVISSLVGAFAFLIANFPYVLAGLIGAGVAFEAVSKNIQNTIDVMEAADQVGKDLKTTFEKIGDENIFLQQAASVVKVLETLEELEDARSRLETARKVPTVSLGVGAEVIAFQPNFIDIQELEQNLAEATEAHRAALLAQGTLVVDQAARRQDAERQERADLAQSIADRKDMRIAEAKAILQIEKDLAVKIQGINLVAAAKNEDTLVTLKKIQVAIGNALEEVAVTGNLGANSLARITKQLELVAAQVDAADLRKIASKEVVKTLEDMADKFVKLNLELGELSGTDTALEDVRADFILLAATAADTVEIFDELIATYDELALKLKTGTAAVDLGKSQVVDTRTFLTELATLRTESENLKASLADLTGQGTGSLALAAKRFAELGDATNLTTAQVASSVEEFEALQAAIKKTAAEIAEFQQLKDIFSEVSDSLADAIAEGIVDGFADGLDSAKDFADSLQNILKNALKTSLSDSISGLFTGEASQGLLGKLLGGVTGNGASGSGGGILGFIQNLSTGAPGEARFVDSGFIGPLEPGQIRAGTPEAATAAGATLQNAIGVTGAVAATAVSGIIDIINAFKAPSGVGPGTQSLNFENNAVIKATVKTIISTGLAIVGGIFLGAAGSAAGSAVGAILGDLVGNSISNIRNNPSLSENQKITRQAAIAIDPFFSLIINAIFGLDDKVKRKAQIATSSEQFGGVIRRGPGGVLLNDGNFEGPLGGFPGPFGFVGLHPRSKFLDEEFRTAVSKAVVDFDENIAKFLTPADILKVSDALQSTSAINVKFSVFDNEFGQIIFDRVKTIVGGLGANVERFFGGFTGGEDLEQEEFETKIAPAIQEFFQLRKEVQELRDTLFKPLVSLSTIVQALKDVNEQFDILAEQAPDFGVDIADLEQQRLARLKEFTDEFNLQVQNLISGLDGPSANQIRDLQLLQEARLADAIALGADLVELERLSMKERLRLVEEIGKDIVAVLAAINADAFGKASPVDILAASQVKFDEILSLSQAGDVNAFATLGAAAEELIQATQGVFGSSATFFESLGFIKLTLENLLANTGSLFGISESGFGELPQASSAAEEFSQVPEILVDVNTELARGQAVSEAQLAQIIQLVSAGLEVQDQAQKDQASKDLARNTASRVA